MKVLERRRSLVHTHFVTDGQRLPTDRVREIERGVVPVLRELGIVFGIHLAPPTPPGGIEIVLECIPAEPEMRRIEETLTRAIAPIPTRPPVTVARVSGDESTTVGGPGVPTAERSGSDHRPGTRRRPR
jgi:hypothetical protein